MLTNGGVWQSVVIANRLPFMLSHLIDAQPCFYGVKRYAFSPNQIVIDDSLFVGYYLHSGVRVKVHKLHVFHILSLL